MTCSGCPWSAAMSCTWNPSTSARSRRTSWDAWQQKPPNAPVVWQIPPGIEARGDPHLLEILLDNLLGNAWKYTRKVAQARIELGARIESPAGAVYFVRDNGAGFDMQFAHKLFTPFQRLHTISEFEGTGIGLATVARIVRRHGGRVWAESQPGQGSTFYFTLETEPHPHRRATD